MKVGKLYRATKTLTTNMGDVKFLKGEIIMLLEPILVGTQWDEGDMVYLTTSGEKKTVLAVVSQVDEMFERVK